MPASSFAVIRLFRRALLRAAGPPALALALALALTLAPGAGAAAAERVSGPARVVDGDTLEVSGRHVRLQGLDAPEMDQSCRDAEGAAYPCGRRAAEAMRRLTEGREVVCAGVGTDPWGRLVADCRAGGRDLGAALTRAGWALAFRKFSDRLIPQEEAARAEGAGLWAGEFEAPWNHRAAARAAERAEGLARAEARRAEGECVIKGNRSANGRIFHMPGQRDYARTRIDEAKGERWFCSPEAAIAAGWRPARN